jgi:membrane protein YqaA with SNARE-associated domain
MHRITELLQRLDDIIQPLAEQLGAFGLVLVAFLDSSFLSLPQANDALVVVSTIRSPARWLLYALASTIGSILGCLVLYFLGRRGGEAFLRRKFKGQHVDRGLAMFKRYGWLAVVVPSLLPPPTPFKLFVLLAGVTGIRPAGFVAAVAIGRGFRYTLEAWLARQYGSQATAFIGTHLQTISIWLALTILVVTLGYVVWRRRRPAAAE